MKRKEEGGAIDSLTPINVELMMHNQTGLLGEKKKKKKGVGRKDKRFGGGRTEKQD